MPPLAVGSWVAAVEQTYAADAGMRRDEAIRSATPGAAFPIFAAQAHGLASCPMVGFDAERLAREFALAADEIPVLLVAVGHAAEGNRPQKPRLPVAQILTTLQQPEVDMPKPTDILLTALAPAVWGSTYIVATELLPGAPPLSVAAIRALPTGLILLLLVRQLPKGDWLWRSFVLGALNFTVFWALLFVAAYRLPGGIAATVGAVQPLIVVFAASAVLGTRIRVLSVLAAVMGMAGVALLVLQDGAVPDMPGIAAALGGAFSMAFGTVLTRKWRPPVSALVLTAWQLTAGGLLLLPLALLLDPPMPPLDAANAAGMGYLVLFTALTYILWFRGVARLEPAAVSSLGFLSPLTAILLGWAILGQALSASQMIGAAVVVASIWLSQRATPSRQVHAR